MHTQHQMFILLLNTKKIRYVYSASYRLWTLTNTEPSECLLYRAYKRFPLIERTPNIFDRDFQNSIVIHITRLSLAERHSRVPCSNIHLNMSTHCYWYIRRCQLMFLSTIWGFAIFALFSLRIGDVSLIGHIGIRPYFHFTHFILDWQRWRWVVRLRKEFGPFDF